MLKSDDIKHLLHGKWLLTDSKHEHYLIFAHKNGVDSYKSKHRKGTYSVEKNDDGEIILKLSSATHPRILQVVDKNTIAMKFTYHGKEIKDVYKRQSLLRRLLSCLKRRIPHN